MRLAIEQLQPYLQHKPDCALARCVDCEPPCDCTCGLDALLAAETPQAWQFTCEEYEELAEAMEAEEYLTTAQMLREASRHAALRSANHIIAEIKRQGAWASSQAAKEEK